ncbi:MAG: hypothetical protein EOO88_50475, partial [Pedobacter sp.]
MKKRLRILLPAFTGSLFVLYGLPMQAQTVPSKDKPAPGLIVATDTVPAIINYTTAEGATKFTSELRALRQIAGAPEPFYTYFWEF